MNRLLNHLKGDGLKAQLLKGATGTAGLKAVNVLLTLAVGVLLARALGPENYGIYAFVLSLITLLGLPTKAGLPTLIVRETAKYQLQEKWSNLRGLLTLANAFVIGFSILIAIVAAVSAWWLWGGDQSVKVSTFIWALPLLPLIAFGNIRGATLRGLRKVVQGQLPEQLVRPLIMLILLMVALVFMHEKISSNLAVQFNVAASLVAFLVGAFLLSAAIPKKVKTTEPYYEVKVWEKALLPLSLISGISIINGEIGIILLGILATPEEVGFYRIALSFVALISLGNSILAPIMEPQITRIYKTGDLDKLTNILKMSSRFSVSCALAFLVIFYFFGEIVLKLLFGVDYTSAWLTVLILAFGSLTGLSVGIAGTALKQIYLENIVLKSALLTLCINLILSLILIPTFGLNGVAVAFSISFAFHNLYKGIALYRITGINPSII
jgi:O-antigen/teichoic acid export membrane protein